MCHLWCITACYGLHFSVVESYRTTIQISPLDCIDSMVIKQTYIHIKSSQKVTMCRGLNLTTEQMCFQSTFKNVTAKILVS